jgi:CDP-glucose 4,6-dehydratase
MIARSYTKTYDLPICVVRCGNLYGGGDLNLSRLIPGTTLRLLNEEQPVLYSDAKEMTREFIHVQDIISAYMILIEKGIDGEAYNVGASILYKIGDVIDKIRDLINKEIDIKIIKRDLFEIKEQMLNADKLKSLGWNPSLSLDEGLDEAVTWYKARWKRTTCK